MPLAINRYRVLACAAAAAVTSLLVASLLLRRRRKVAEALLGSARADSGDGSAAAQADRGLGQGPSSAADGRSLEDLLRDVEARSKAVLYVVSTAKNDKFSLPNLTKYLRMKGVEVFEGATQDESLHVNARRLLEFMDKAASAPGAQQRAAPGVPLRHELIPAGYSCQDLEERFESMKEAYVQQPLDYGRNSRYGDKWRISCYLVVLENWKPKIQPHPPMVECMGPVMDRCTDLFGKWYCGVKSLASVDVSVMNAFVTRYRPIHEEDQLKKHIDGSNVDGSVILALPTDDPFEGGELLVWDGKPQKEFVYRMAPGDLLFLDNAVWHQARPISSGTRWALVLFLRLQGHTPHGSTKTVR